MDNGQKPKAPKKAIRVSPVSLTKGLSITLPQVLIDRLNQLEISSQGVNISKTIRHILEEYLETTGDGGLLPEISPSDCLIPVDLYSDIMQVGRITIKNRAAKGEITIVNMYSMDFVQCSKDDMINYFGQVQMYRDDVKQVKAKITEIEGNYEVFNELIREFEILKKEIYKRKDISSDTNTQE